jgi:hypothetical protein
MIITSKEEYTARRKLWIDALRSGYYTQGSTYLAQKNGNNGLWSHCCFGVACELLPVSEPIVVLQETCTVKMWGETALKMGEFEMSYYGLTIEGTHKLMYMNDKVGYSFKEIAQALEITPEKFFEPGTY